MDINTFSEPSEYMRAASQKGVPVSTTFGWAISQTMINRGLTFPQACKLLEVARILMWAGDCPIINLAGYDFWMRNADEAVDLGKKSQKRRRNANEA